jgi:glucosamine 6-phosphate synthetase-like amidotransferase/phosphosugar isomerase protein
MLKEINEQPTAVGNTVLAACRRTPTACVLDEIGFRDEQWKASSRSAFLPCGTSWHSALLGKHMIESLARVPVEVDYASEFRLSRPCVPSGQFSSSSSRSPAKRQDTISAQRLVRESGGSKILTITNVVGSHDDAHRGRCFCTRARPGDRRGIDEGFTTAAGLSLPCGDCIMGRFTRTIAGYDMRRMLEELKALAAQDGREAAIRQERGEIRSFSSVPMTFCSLRVACTFQ